MCFGTLFHSFSQKEPFSLIPRPCDATRGCVSSKRSGSGSESGRSPIRAGGPLSAPTTPTSHLKHHKLIKKKKEEPGHILQLTLVTMVKRPLGVLAKRPFLFPLQLVDANLNKAANMIPSGLNSRFIKGESFKLKLRVRVQTGGAHGATGSDWVSRPGLDTSLDEQRIIGWQVGGGSRCSWWC